MASLASHDCPNARVSTSLMPAVICAATGPSFAPMFSSSLLQAAKDNAVAARNKYLVPFIFILSSFHLYLRILGYCSTSLDNQSAFTLPPSASSHPWMVQPSTVMSVLCRVTLRLYCRPATHSFCASVSPASTLASVKSSVALNDCPPGQRVTEHLREENERVGNGFCCIIF